MSKIDWKNKEKLEEIIKGAKNARDALQIMHLRAAGGNYKTLNRYIKKYNINTSHFTQRHDKMVALNKNLTIPLSDILNGGHPQYNSSRLKQRLLESGIKENICEECGQLPIWNNKKLVLQIEHINGDNSDHKLENIKIICPNCHTQTSTYAGKNSSKVGNCKRIKKYGTVEEYNNIRNIQYEKEQKHYVDKLINSNIDFTKYGWVGKASIIINQKPQIVSRWMKRLMPEFYENKCYKRGSR